MRDMMRRLKLTVNENKTRVCRLPEEKFDFLGYTFGRCYSSQTGRAYLGTTPSKQRVQRVCAASSQLTRRSTTLLDGIKPCKPTAASSGWIGPARGPIAKTTRPGWSRKT